MGIMRVTFHPKVRMDLFKCKSRTLDNQIDSKILYSSCPLKKKYLQFQTDLRKKRKNIHENRKKYIQFFNNG